MKLNDFEQLCFLFENNENDAILKTKERLVKVFIPTGHQVEKYKEMQKNEKLWSTAMAIQMGEARYRNGLNDSYKEGLEKGREEGIKEGKEAGERLILNQLIENIYHEDATTWLQSLTIEQLNSISRMILSCDTFDELKKYVYNSL
ncbi:MAG: transposase [Erysipelotrichaceae bacterium]|nr:transposase [Erysipelotrichaceae bacterium]